MRNSNIQFSLIIAGLLLFLATCINGQVAVSPIGQDSYGSSCNLGRQVFVIKNKYVVELIAPIGWQKDNSLLRSSGVESFYPEIDSINRETNIFIHQSPISFSKLNIDSIIQNINAKYQKEWNIITDENQKNLFHSSVPTGNLYLFKDTEMNLKESIAYIFSDDYIMAFIFKPSNSKKYNEYLDAYMTLLSSIRCSKITR
jgi:hypothetical protein